VIVLGAVEKAQLLEGLLAAGLGGRGGVSSFSLTCKQHIELGK
jgi:hypothetical protein